MYSPYGEHIKIKSAVKAKLESDNLLIRNDLALTNTRGGGGGMPHRHKTSFYMAYYPGKRCPG
jgi:hypothetical protein